MPVIPEFSESLFLEGPAGTGKTTAAVEYVKRTIESGVSPDSILIFTPREALSQRYQTAFVDAGVSTLPHMMTFESFVQEMLTQFWSQITAPNTNPVFLNAELMRYYLSRVADPYIRSGVFQGIRLSKSRLIGQIFDHLQQITANGLTIEEAEERAVAAWLASRVDKRKIYQAVSTILHQYRAFCAENHLLDWAAQTDLFFDHLLDQPAFEEFYTSTYQTLIVDNIEEMRAIEHDFVFWCIEKTERTLVIYDKDAGYDIFTGADALDAVQFRDVCRKKVRWDKYVKLSSGVTALINNVAPLSKSADAEALVSNHSATWDASSATNFPEMVNQCLQSVQKLVLQQKVSPGEIAIVSPYVTDALRFSLQSSLESLKIPSQVLRPSRPLTSEPFIRAIMTLLRLVVPTETPQPTREEVTHMLHLLIEGLDPIRAGLLAQGAYQRQLLNFERLNRSVRERISPDLGKLYEDLWAWIYENAQLLPKISLAEYLEQLASELLSQAGYSYASDLDAQRSLKQFIESARNFQNAVDTHHLFGDAITANLEFLNALREGTITGSLPDSSAEPDAVLISPIYHYLLHDRTVTYQFWLDVGNPSWWKSWEQPITQPYELQRSFTARTDSTENADLERQQEQLQNITLGLLRRCRKKVFTLAIASEEISPQNATSVLSIFASQPVTVLP